MFSYFTVSRPGLFLFLMVGREIGEKATEYFPTHNVLNNIVCWFLPCLFQFDKGQQKEVMSLKQDWVYIYEIKNISIFANGWWVWYSIYGTQGLLYWNGWLKKRPQHLGLSTLCENLETLPRISSVPHYKVGGIVLIFLINKTKQKLRLSKFYKTCSYR